MPGGGVVIRKRAVPIAVALIVLAGVSLLLATGGGDWLGARLRGGQTVADAVQKYGTSARQRLEPSFSDAKVGYPPERITLAAIKDQKVVELWAADHDEDLKLIKTYPVLAASGHAGPKLMEGDRQVPEGIYEVSALNPNSSYHLSIKVDYPNEFDLQQARRDGRDALGGDIFIHGSNVSIGCLAMGDPAIEELFVLVADVGRENVRVLIAPSDPRRGDLSTNIDDAPGWLPDLYKRIEEEFRLLPETGRS